MSKASKLSSLKLNLNVVSLTLQFPLLNWIGMVSDKVMHFAYTCMWMWKFV